MECKANLGGAPFLKQPFPLKIAVELRLELASESGEIDSDQKLLRNKNVLLACSTDFKRQLSMRKKLLVVFSVCTQI